MTKGLEAVVRVMQSKAPSAVIILMGIFPRNDNMAVMPEIDRINANLARMADGRKIRYLDINDKLADRDGKLHDGMMNDRDKLHPVAERISSLGGRAEAGLHGTARAARK